MDKILQLNEHTPSKVNHFGRYLRWLTLPIEGAPYMNKINIAGLYQAGANIDPLCTITKDATYESIYGYLAGARNAVRMLIDHHIVPLPITRGALRRFQVSIDEAIEHVKKTGASTYHGPVRMEDRIGLKVNGSQVVESLHAELENADTYYVTEVAGYNTQTLIEHGEKLLGETLLTSLSDDVKTDFCEATKALAFRLHTAVGFHVLRAVEAGILEYLDILKIARPTRPIERNLGNYIALLRQGGVDEKVLLPLELLRKEHRNELMHPDKTLEKDESLLLFEVSKGALMTLMTDVNTRKGTSSAAAAT